MYYLNNAKEFIGEVIIVELETVIRFNGKVFIFPSNL